MKRTASHAFVLVLIVATSLLLGYNRGLKASRIEVKTIIDTLIVHDTTVHIRPVSVVSRIVDSILVPVTDTIMVRDSVFLPLPREERVYEDSTYRAVVSGFRPSLDSLWVFRDTKYVTVTTTQLAPAPRFSFGLSAGPAVVLSPDGSLHGGLGIIAGLNIRMK